MREAAGSDERKHAQLDFLLLQILQHSHGEDGKAELQRSVLPCTLSICAEV